MKKIHLLISSALCLGLTACFDMNQEPQGELSTTGAFTSTGEIRTYLNMFYEGSIPVSGGGTASNTVIKTQPGGVGNSGIAFGDAQSDNLCPSSVDSRLMGFNSIGNAVVMNDYKPIRNLNFLLQNIENCQDKGSEYEQYLGEAYYFRAAFYYHLLVNYGGVTWTDQMLDPDLGQMQLPRNTRTELTDYILADLDLAIENLNEQSSNATMRVHKDVARALKSEVALFAATWEKYHREDQDDFYDHTLDNPDAKIQDWLNQALEAANAVISRGVWQIQTGDPLTVYRDMFIDADLSDNQEVLWWKRYDPAAGIGHSITRYLAGGGGLFGASASLVDDYLTRDGRPFVGAEKLEAKRTYGAELDPTLRDPRLSQTICMPGQPMGNTNYKFPPLDATDFNQNTTGYSMLKYLEFNTSNTAAFTTDGQSQAPAIQVRYADVLLNYAEALAELDGAANASRIASALNQLRARVDMPNVDFNREYNTESDYPFRDLDPYIQAVRRERRVEKAFENTRLTDILRWSAADVLINGVTPTGALYTGSNLGAEFEGILSEEAGNIRLTGSAGDADRYIIPPGFEDYPTGWEFNLGRDYLLPIRQDMLGSLTGGAWEQNPGW